VFDQIQERVRRPVQILEDDDQRSIGGERLNEQAPRGEDLVAVATLGICLLYTSDAADE